MLKVSVQNEATDVIELIKQLSPEAIKSMDYYSSFNQWFEQKFEPEYYQKLRDIVCVRDKRYKTIIGFSLLKRGEENKICNLSPLVDGVGITQVLLDSSHLYFENDYSIDVPLIATTSRLHTKLDELGFVQVSKNRSRDNTEQMTYYKVRNLGWI